MFNHSSSDGLNKPPNYSLAGRTMLQTMSFFKKEWLLFRSCLFPLSNQQTMVNLQPERPNRHLRSSFFDDPCWRTWRNSIYRHTVVLWQGLTLSAGYLGILHKHTSLDGQPLSPVRGSQLGLRRRHETIEALTGSPAGRQLYQQRSTANWHRSSKGRAVITVIN